MGWRGGWGVGERLRGDSGWGMGEGGVSGEMLSEVGVVGGMKWGLGKGVGDGVMCGVVGNAAWELGGWGGVRLCSQVEMWERGLRGV